MCACHQPSRKEGGVVSHPRSVLSLPREDDCLVNQHTFNHADRRGCTVAKVGIKYVCGVCAVAEQSRKILCVERDRTGAADTLLVKVEKGVSG